MIEFHIELNGKAARVGLHGLIKKHTKAQVRYSTGAGDVRSVRMLTGMKKRTHAGINLQSLTEGDPELDLQMAGSLIDADATPAYFDPDAETLKPIGNFNDVDLILDANDTEKSRRPHVNRKANINDVGPIKVLKRLPLEEALGSFVPKQTLQVAHVDGLSFEFLRDAAKSLHEKNEAAIVGSGAKGNMPLVLRDGGTAYRAYLVGKVEGDRYQLLLVLSDQELKMPQPAAE
jgi:hypothetical protein